MRRRIMLGRSGKEDVVGGGEFRKGIEWCGFRVVRFSGCATASRRAQHETNPQKKSGAATSNALSGGLMGELSRL